MADEQLDMVEETENEEFTVEVEETADSGVSVGASEAEVEESADQFDKAENSTQKRINQLTKKMRQAERDREEAIRYATQVQTEAQTLKQRVDALDSGYVNEFSGRVQSELQSAENDLKNAIEIGDSAQIVESQRKITGLAIQAQRRIPKSRDGGSASSTSASPTAAGPASA